MKASPEIKVSKLDAARRQMETAITLYFSYGDPVSIHTLASAGYNILNDVCANREVEIKHVRKVLLDRVMPENKKQVIKHLKHAENFFKHADRDSEESTSLNPLASEYVLLDATQLYFGLAGEMPPLFSMYRTWWYATNRHLLIDKQSPEFRLYEANASLLQNRKLFYTQALPTFSKLVGS